LTDVTDVITVTQFHDAVLVSLGAGSVEPRPSGVRQPPLDRQPERQAGVGPRP